MRKLSVLLILLLLFGIASTAAFASPVDPMSNHSDEEDSDTTDSDDEEDTQETDEEDNDSANEDSDDDGVDDETEEAFEREVDVDQDKREWKIESEMKNGENKDKFKAEFKIAGEGGGDEPEIKLEYASETGSNETEMKYRVNFDEIIEFKDDGTPGYQEDIDEIVSIYELDKAGWNEIVYSTENANGATLYTAKAQTIDGIFTLILKLTTGFTEVNNTIVTPNAIKIDIVIDGYDYQANNTYLTLQTDIKTEAEVQVEEDSEDEENGFADNESQVAVDAGTAAGFFSWVKTAEADGTTIDVLSSTLQAADEQDDDIEEGEKHQIMFFTFDHQNADRIVWDPKVGVVVTNNLDNAAVTGLPAPFWIIFISLAIPIWYRRRN